MVVASRQSLAKQTSDLLLGGTVEDRSRQMCRTLHMAEPDIAQPVRPMRLNTAEIPALLSDPTKMGLQYLSDIHSARYTQRVEHDVNRRAVLEERHVLDRQDLGDDALVAVPSGELVAVLDLALLGHVYPNQLGDAR